MVRSFGEVSVLIIQGNSLVYFLRSIQIINLISKLIQIEKNTLTFDQLQHFYRSFENIENEFSQNRRHQNIENSNK